MNEDQRELYQAANAWSALAKHVRETGLWRPEDVADIMEALAFLHTQLGWYLHQADRHMRRGG
jgi:hypothetical protein